MASAPPFVFHQPKHARPEHDTTHPHRARLPVIPDLRFEHSYLRSIRPYIQVRKLSNSENSQKRREESEDEPGYEKVDLSIVDKGKGKELEPTAIPAVVGEVVDIQWNKVIWITTRDQVISPLLQGALWALASYFLTPFVAQLGGKVGGYVRSKIHPREGGGITWLRNTVKRFQLVNNDRSHVGQS
ncbi:hypothetical protein BDQ12DRAFT_638886 [Crucibulum laeve]|uniref:Uncharacterized protein n=1 Tax=Crucibulum laeve TaxID=68775 RepID=A0A5C3LUB5_9AGAR|nr:hypothetical protein BDQ12DRAFT_638886 [Crucibulum laeve]